MTILVTGANGFIGRHLCAFLKQQGYCVRAVVRRRSALIPGIDTRLVESWHALKANADLFAGVDCVLHLAGRAHVLKETDNPARAFQQANVESTRCWLQAAAEQQVKRFVFVSSIGVHGDSTQGLAINETSPCAPAAPYAISKWAAETVVQEIAELTGMEYVIVRPPLVYGPDAPGNFQRLLQLLQTGLPLPLARFCRQRNLVSVWNLVDFLALCSQQPAAANAVFVLADTEAVSVAELLNALGDGFGKRNHLFACPPGVLALGLTLLGKRDAFDKLAAELRVDNTKARALLNWTPPLTAYDGLWQTGAALRLSREIRR